MILRSRSRGPIKWSKSEEANCFSLANVYGYNTGIIAGGPVSRFVDVVAP